MKHHPKSYDDNLYALQNEMMASEGYDFHDGMFNPISADSIKKTKKSSTANKVSLIKRSESMQVMEESMFSYAEPQSVQNFENKGV